MTKNTSQWNNISIGVRGPESRMSEPITAAPYYIATGKDKEINHIVHGDDGCAMNVLYLSKQQRNDRKMRVFMEA